MPTTHNWRYEVADLPKLSPFGSVQAENICLSRFDGSNWSSPELVSMSEFTLHPGAHCIHYGSACFEGLKAYRWPDDSLVLYRPQDHAARMSRSGALLHLAAPQQDQFITMCKSIVLDAAEHIPPAPGALYLRPVLIGSDTNIGAASTPSRTAIFYVMASPVGDYFGGGERALRLLIKDDLARTAPNFGEVKTGANYAAALGTTRKAKEQWNADQVLFCPNGNVQETGAANFLMIDDHTIVTKPLDSSFLHGITRDSILAIAKDLGYAIEERNFTVDDLLEWTNHGEAALSGTAAVLASVGSLIYRDQEYTLCSNQPGPNTRRLRKALNDIQQGIVEDARDWIIHVQ